MRLIRKDRSFTADPENPDDYSREEHGFEQEELDEIVRVDFPDFGRGKERRPSFSVEVTWIDVKYFLRAFMEMGEHDAVYIHRLLKLAEAVEEAGWSPDWAPTKELIETLSPQLD